MGRVNSRLLLDGPTLRLLLYHPPPTLDHISMAANSSTSAQIGWQKEPATRGTWSILSTCLFTLLLCVYTAVHLNMPHEGDTKIRGLVRRLVWVICGMFVPELIVCFAWEQWLSARSLTTAMIKLRDEFPARFPGQMCPEFLKKWTLTHGFFVDMGGYQMEAASDQSAPGLCRRLSGAAVLDFASIGWDFPSPSQKELEDRSKADRLTKCLTCVQTTYFVVLLVSRKAHGLHITTLEVNTLGHVLCAFATFVPWFNKPLNVNFPLSVGAH